MYTCDDVMCCDGDVYPIHCSVEKEVGKLTAWQQHVQEKKKRVKELKEKRKVRIHLVSDVTHHFKHSLFICVGKSHNGGDTRSTGWCVWG